MNYGAGISVTGVDSPGNAGTITGADNGLSKSTVNPALVVWGQDLGSVLDEAKLLSDRRIPFNKKSMTMDGLGADINPAPGLNNVLWLKKVRNTGGVWNSNAVVIGDTNDPVWAVGQNQIYQNADLLISKSPGSDFDNPVFLEMSAATNNLNGFLFMNLGANFGEYFPEQRVASNGRAGVARAFSLEMYARDSSPGVPQFLTSWNDYNNQGFAMPNSDFLGWLNGTNGTDPNDRYFLYVDKHYSFMLGASPAVPVSNGATLQVLGDLTTADPGSGQGKWKMGKVIAAAVTVDLTHYVEVMIDGALTKLIVAN